MVVVTLEISRILRHEKHPTNTAYMTTVTVVTVRALILLTKAVAAIRCDQLVLRRPSVPAAVIVTLTDLEARGVHVRLLADGMLGVAPCGLVTRSTWCSCGATGTLWLPPSATSIGWCRAERAARPLST
jgi:hypothetical protein